MFLSLKNQTFELICEVNAPIKFIGIWEKFCGVETCLCINLFQRKSKESFIDAKKINFVKDNSNWLDFTEFNYKAINYGDKSYGVRNRDGKFNILECSILRYLPYEDKTAFLIGSKPDEFSLILYDFGTNVLLFSIELPAYFEPFSLALNEETTKLFIIAFRMGAQDLAPADSSSLETIPYQEHYLYTIDIEKFKVAFDGKLNKATMGLTNIKKLNKDIVHVRHLKDDYFVCSSNNDVSFYQLNYETSTLEHLDIVPDIHLDGSEHDQLQKSMTTKLLKEEITVLNSFGVLNNEIVHEVCGFKDSLSDSGKLFFLSVLSNFKIYLYKIEFLHNEFYFLQMSEIEDSEKLVPFETTYLGGLKIDQPINNATMSVINNDCLKVHACLNEIWELKVKRKIDAYFKNIEYQLSKTIIADD